MSFYLKSPAFDTNSKIPQPYTGEGQDISPNLEWMDPPLGAKEFALICDDPDAPRDEPWVHWLIYKIPPPVSNLPEGIAPSENPVVLIKAYQGRNSWNKIGYGGPMPPVGHGTHHYNFKLYALDKELELGPGATREELEKAMATHIIGEATLVGTYER